MQSACDPTRQMKFYRATRVFLKKISSHHVSMPLFRSGCCTRQDCDNVALSDPNAGKKPRLRQHAPAYCRIRLSCMRRMVAMNLASIYYATVLRVALLADGLTTRIATHARMPASASTLELWLCTSVKMVTLSLRTRLGVALEIFWAVKAYNRGNFRRDMRHIRGERRHFFCEGSFTWSYHNLSRAD